MAEPLATVGGDGSQPFKEAGQLVVFKGWRNGGLSRELMCL